MSVFIYVLQLILLALVYVITGRAGLTLQSVNHFATLLWLPSGISLAILLRGGYRFWPGIYIGAFILNIITGAPVFVALGIALGNTLEAVISRVILKQFIHFQNSLEHPKDLLSLFFIAPLGAIISGSIGVVSLALGNVLPQNTLSVTWIEWWTGDVTSVILITPFLLTWMTHVTFHKPAIKHAIEAFAATLLLFFLCLLVFTNIFSLGKLHRAYFLFIPLTWIGLRFGKRTTVTALIIVASFALFGALTGYGPFPLDDANSIGLRIQSYIATLTMTSLILATTVDENRKLAKRKDEFISIASHELKTPLTSITLLLQLLQKRFQGQKNTSSKKLITRTTEQVAKMNNLVVNLLDLSIIQMGQYSLQKEKFFIDDLIKNVISMNQNITKTHKILCNGRTKKAIIADKEKITQVLINLVNNAIKYSPKANKILISLRTTKQHVCVDVTDFGIGVEKKDYQKIFERFFRANGANKTFYPGFGVGLYIATEIIQKHHGVLSVKSTKGKGSTFSFTLPYV